MVAGAYKATLTEALEVKTHTKLINIVLEGRVTRIIIRINALYTRHMINKEIKKIQ
jgi:hypothetical protein